MNFETVKKNTPSECPEMHKISRCVQYLMTHPIFCTTRPRPNTLNTRTSKLHLPIATKPLRPIQQHEHKRTANASPCTHLLRGRYPLPPFEGYASMREHLYCARYFFPRSYNTRTRAAPTLLKALATKPLYTPAATPSSAAIFLRQSTVPL